MSSILVLFVLIIWLYVTSKHYRCLKECKLNEGFINDVISLMYDPDVEWRVDVSGGNESYFLDDYEIEIQERVDSVWMWSPFKLRFVGKYKKMVEEAISILKQNYLLQMREKALRKEDVTDDRIIKGFIILVERLKDKAILIKKKAKEAKREDVMRYWEGVEFACTKILRTLE